MWRLGVKATTVALAALLGCGGQFGEAADAGDAAEGGPWVCGDIDAAPELTAASPGVCDEQSKVACQAWAQSLVQNATVYSCCGSAAPPPSEEPLRCWMGGPDCSYGPQSIKAACGNGPACASCATPQTPTCSPYNQICVSDVTNSTPHCVFACSE